MLAWEAAGTVITVRPRPRTTFESSRRQPLAVMRARTVVATTRCEKLEMVLVTIVVALVVVVAFVLLRLVLAFAPRFSDTLVITLGALDHPAVLIDASRIVDDLPVLVDTSRIIDDSSIRIDPTRIIDDLPI